MYNICIVVGTRPNIIKSFPVYEAFKRQFSELCNVEIIHTGQHYTNSLSSSLISELQLPITCNLGCTCSERETLLKHLDSFFDTHLYDVVVVIGDVNTTLSAAMSAKKHNMLVAHIEAGLRSSVWSMDEEINRVLVDTLSDFLFISEDVGVENLRKEFTLLNKVVELVGSTVFDALVTVSNKLLSPTVATSGDNYVLGTFHRQSNVDNEKELTDLFNLLNTINNLVPMKVVAHPRLYKNINKYNLQELVKDIEFLSPQGYVDFLNMVLNANVFITDSGGAQEEAVCLNVPTITYREVTEKPCTLTLGNVVTKDKEKIIEIVKKNFLIKRGNTENLFLNGNFNNASTKIATTIVDYLNLRSKNGHCNSIKC
jgi:UDP-N-acetylglucosamine 2-epimerase (non-hydrolysing)